jgi:uncharacterized membrane protein
MKNFKLSATFTMILGILSVLALIFLFLALSDIAHAKEDLTLEWFVTRASMIILAAFTISAFVTLGFGFKCFKTLQNPSKQQSDNIS